MARKHAVPEQFYMVGNPRNIPVKDATGRPIPVIRNAERGWQEGDPIVETDVSPEAWARFLQHGFVVPVELED